MVIRQIIAFHSLLTNPHQYAATVLAKLCINVATLIWSFLVLWKPGAIRLWPGADFVEHLAIGSFEGEDTFAVFLAITSIISCVRLILHAKPIPLGSVIYGILATFWMYVLFSLVIAIQLGITAMRPGQLASIIVITALALFAFIANPKKRQRDDSMAD
jgi:hypothetical protein